MQTPTAPRRLPLALRAALLGAALAPTAAAAQRTPPAPRPAAAPPAPAAAGGPSEATLRALAAELADLQRRREAAAERLERFAATLRSREASPLVHDSLLLLVREHTELGTRASMVAARLSLREAERDRVVLRRTMPSPPSAPGAPAAPAPPPAPEGWFGVNVEQRPTASFSNGTVLTVSEYPRVLSVEPASPAARAGMQAGDRLLAIDGIDLREQAVDLARLLRPGRTLPVRIARDGRVQEVRVVVTSRPRTFVSGVTVRVTEERTGATEARASTRPLPPDGATRVLVRGAPPGMTAPSPLTLFYRSPNVALLAGAEVVHLPPELREALEVRGGVALREGVLVVQVAPGSLAERAGLRGGDVLVRANGRALSSPEVLHRVATEAAAGDASQVRLELLRDRQPRTVTLRW